MSPPTAACTAGSACSAGGVLFRLLPRGCHVVWIDNLDYHLTLRILRDTIPIEPLGPCWSRSPHTHRRWGDRSMTVESRGKGDGMEEIKLPSREEMKQLTPVELAHVHMRAEDQKDVQATVDTFTDDDPWYTIPVLGVDLVGKDQIHEHYSGLLHGSFGEFANVEIQVRQAEDRVFCQGFVEARFTEPWFGVPPNGNHIRTGFIAILPIAPDGFFKAETTYFDVLDFHHQMGVLPSQSIVNIVGLLGTPVEQPGHSG
jgi:hypothetical protein